MLLRPAAGLYAAMADHKAPPMIWVLLVCTSLRLSQARTLSVLVAASSGRGEINTYKIAAKTTLNNTSLAQ